MTPAICHVVPAREIVGERAALCKPAWESWAEMYRANCGMVIPRHCWGYTRTAVQLGDDRDVPYIKDILNHGMDGSKADDIILYTNEDIIIHPRAIWDIRTMLKKNRTACCLRRVDFHEAIPSLGAEPEYWASIGKPTLGRDGFAFMVHWLFTVMDKIPDLLIGSWGWDILFSGMIREAVGGRFTALKQLSVTDSESDTPLGDFGHCYHAPHWDSVERKATPSNAHNHQLFDEYRKAHWPRLDMAL